MQSDQLFSIGADSSPGTSLSLSIYNLLLYGKNQSFLEPLTLCHKSKIFKDLQFSQDETVCVLAIIFHKLQMYLQILTILPTFFMPRGFESAIPQSAEIKL